MQGKILNDAKKEISSCEDQAQLKQIRKKYLGTSGIITRELLNIKTLPHYAQRKQGKSFLNLHNTFNSLHDKKKKELS